MAAELITVQVDGQTWYCDSLKVKNQIESIKDKSAQKSVLESLSTGKNPLVSLDENAFVDISEISDDDNKTNSLSSSDTTKGLDQTSYKEFLQSNGFDKLNTITDKSSSSDIQKALDEITAKSKELDSMIDKLTSCKSPDEIESVFSTITNLSESLNSLSTTTEKATPKKPTAISNTLNSAGITLGTIGSTWAGIGTVAALAMSTNPIGWAIGAGVGLLTTGVSIAKSISDSKNADLYQGYQDVKGKIEEAKSELDKKKTEAADNVNTALAEIMETSANHLENVIGDDGEPVFSDMTPTSVLNNISDVKTIQSELQEYQDVCEKYGIETEYLTNVMNLLKGDDNGDFGQNYLDTYANNLLATYSGDIACDTIDFEQLYTDLSTMCEDAKSAGLDTSTINTLLERINTLIENEKAEAEAEAEALADNTSIKSGDGTQISDDSTVITGELTGISDGIETTGNTELTDDNEPTAYNEEVNTLIAASQDLKTANQDEIDTYVKAIDPSTATSLAALDELYNYVDGNFTGLDDMGTIYDIKGLESKLDEIKAAKQSIIDKKQTEFEELLEKAATVEDYKEVADKIKTYISKHSEHKGVDMTGMAALSMVAVTKKESLETPDDIDIAVDESSEE